MWCWTWGSGTGILALFACQAGARKVYAVEAGDVVELAKQVCRKNGLQDRVVFLHALSERVDLPERVDVLVTETLGNFGLEEGLLGAVIDARARWLNANGAIVPQSVELFIAPVAMMSSERRGGSDGDEPVLLEVAVEGEGIGDPQPLHDDEADGVGKGKVLVSVAQENLLSSRFVLGADTNNDGLALSGLAQELSSLSDTESGEDKGVRFNTDDVGSELLVAGGGEFANDGHRIGVVLVVFIEEGEVGGGVNEDPAMPQ